MRSAVNIQRLPHAVVPDNGRSIALIGQLGDTIGKGIKQYKARGLRDDLLGGQSEIDDQGVADSEAIDATEKQAIDDITQKAEAGRVAARGQSRLRQVIGDPEQSKKLMRLAELDPEMYRGVVGILQSDDEMQRVELAKKAQDANRFYNNYGVILQQQGKTAADNYALETARPMYAEGEDVSKIMALRTAQPDQAAALATQYRALSGDMLSLPPVMSAYQNAQLEDADADRKLAQDKFNFTKQKDSLDRQKPEKEKQRRIISEDGVNYYADTGKRVLDTPKIDKKAEKQQAANAQAYQAFDSAAANMMGALADTNTGAIAGRLPAITSGQQVAEGAIATMAPVLKQIFRSAGEGVFTDKDQELLMNMLPKRTDEPEAIQAKMKGVRAVVEAKLGIKSEQNKRLVYNPQSGEFE